MTGGPILVQVHGRLRRRRNRSEAGGEIQVVVIVFGHAIVEVQGVAEGVVLEGAVVAGLTEAADEAIPSRSGQGLRRPLSDLVPRTNPPVRMSVIPPEDRCVRRGGREGGVGPKSGGHEHPEIAPSC